MIRVFIDESGNLGRGGTYFVIAAALFLTNESAKRARRIMRHERKILSNTNHKKELIPEIKSCKLTFPERQRIINKLLQIPGFEVFFFVDKKPQTLLLRKNIDNNLAYNYFSRILLDEIFNRYYDDIEILFDARITAIKSTNSLADYLKISAYTRHNYYLRNIQISQGDSRHHYNLQTADLLAGTVYRAYTQSKAHFIELLKPKIISGLTYPPKRKFDTAKDFQ